jgi:hypothetical protein
MKAKTTAQCHPEFLECQPMMYPRHQPHLRRPVNDQQGFSPA